MMEYFAGEAFRPQSATATKSIFYEKPLRPVSRECPVTPYSRIFYV
jgi:hypothetical protein